MHLSFNLTYEIVSYGSYEDLLSFSQVSRLFNKSSSSPDLWKRELCYHMFSEYDLFGDTIRGKKTLTTSECEPDWKGILRKSILIDARWSKLPGHLSQEEAGILSGFLHSVLKDPLPVPPPLRREVKTYQTVVQDFFAHALFPPEPFVLSMPGEASEILDRLQDHQSEILNEVKAI